ncbi:MAG: GNAT family N-acetyltransferase [Chloroflexi bacterium]|nr:GNAT family N-acetyltransferase [Chloroflexota bacterium]
MVGTTPHGAIGGHEVVLVGDGVALRPHTRATLPALKRWYADPDLVRLARHRNVPLSSDEVERLVRERFTTTQMLAFALYERTRTGEQLIGSCTLANLDSGNQTATLHLMIGEPSARGRGLGTEATRLVTGFAFDTLGLHRVSLTLFSFNVAALRCYAKAGFLEEGRMRDAILRDGQRWDEIQMGLLATDAR